MHFHNILLTFTAAVICVSNSSPVTITEMDWKTLNTFLEAHEEAKNDWASSPVETITSREWKALDRVMKAQEVEKTKNYWDDTVAKASSVDAGLRNDWQKLIVAVDNSLTGGPPLEDEIVNAVVKFNTLKYNDCKVDVMRHDVFHMMDTFVDVSIWCDLSQVLSARISPARGSAHIDWLDRPEGYESVTVVIKLFEAMARFLGAKTITYRVGSKEIRSTVFATLLAGEFNSYYHRLGYHFTTDEDTVRGAANELLAITVGDWIYSPAAAGLDIQGMRDRREFYPVKMYRLMQQIYKRATGQEGVPPSKKYKDLLILMVSRIRGSEGGSDPWDSVPGYKILKAERELTKSF
jgi:hypothetical protein